MPKKGRGKEGTSPSGGNGKSAGAAGVMPQVWLPDQVS